jgi:uncharacterized repeat protein (TIGR01451 family)
MTTSKFRGLGLITSLAAAGLLAAVLLVPTAQPAPGDLADLAVTKSDSPDPVTVGATLTYTIRVSNLGPQGATGIVVRDDLPSQLDFVSATTTSGKCDRKGRNVTCAIGDLAADATQANAVSVTIQVRPRKAGTITNTATVDSIETDPVAANDTAQTTTQVVEAPSAASCRGVPAGIVGTPGNDSLTGTAGPDVFVALGGADTIFGLSGRDLICAGGGNDRIRSGSAADRVFAGAGLDLAVGGGGPDLLAGGRGGDVLKGAAGNDRLRGGRGFDRCVGGPGLDRERGCER